MSDWKWWAGQSEEWFTSGPYDTRADAIAEASGESMGEFQDGDGKWKLGFHIVEARQDPLRLADWIRADEVLERADEDIAESDRVACENDEPPYFPCSSDQEADLIDRLKRACDEWQEAHGLKFHVSTFTASRNEEYVIVPHPEGEEA